jgi:hypothetical protein
MPLAKSLAYLYSQANRHREAISIYLKLGQVEAFELIEKYSLFQSVKVSCSRLKQTVAWFWLRF